MTESDNQVYIDKSALAPLQGSSLFYPCSGNDLLKPIQLFSPYVTEFWFVDRGYFAPGHQDTRHYGYDAPADRHRPVLIDDHDYEHVNSNVNGDTRGSKYEVDIKPIILTESYKHIPTGRTIKIHKRRGYGFSAFRREITSLGIFFYRGDSAGEGGSGNMWLKTEHIDEILNKMIDGGLMVLDGSDGTPYRKNLSGQYSSFWKYRNIDFPSAHSVITDVKPFTDRKGNAFTCVGYAGRRYGNTLVWQVKKKEGEA